MARYATVVVLLLLLLAPAPSPFSAEPRAQMSPGCGQELARQDAALRQFHSDATRESVGFLANDVGDEVLGGMKKSLEGDPTADSLEQWQQKYDEWREFLDRGKSMETMMGDLSKCLSGGAGGCLKEITAKAGESSRLLGLANDGFNNWIKSLGDDTISKAAERVEKARSVMQNLGAQAGDMAMDAATGALKNCHNDLERRVQARQTVDLRAAQAAPQPPPGPRPPAPPAGSAGTTSAASGGGHAGLLVGALGAAVGVPIGLKVLNDYSNQVKCDAFQAEADVKINGIINSLNGLIACGTSSSCIASRQPAVNSAASSLNITLGEWCTCLGPSGASELSAQDRAAVGEALNSLRSFGISTGALPSCFR